MLVARRFQCIAIVMLQTNTFAGRKFAAIAMAVAYGLIEVALWTRGRTQLRWSLIAAAWIVATTLLQRRTARELGISRRGLLRSAWVVPAALLVAILMGLAAWMAGTLHGLYGPNPIPYHSGMYVVWAVEQEFILLSFFYVNFEQVLGNPRRASVAAATLFCLAHIPNPVLLVATLALGLCFTQLFRRYRNIYALGIAHGILGLALAVSVPDAMHRHMRVGLGYLRYHASSVGRSATPR